MTITTADRPGRTLLKLTPLALAAMLVSNECRADWKVTPVIDLRETYSDNVNNQTDDLARSSFVTESAPSISIVGNGPRLKVSASGEYRSFAYGTDDIPGLRNSERRYQANAQAMAVDQLLYVDAAASGSRQAVSAFGPLDQNSYSAANGTDIHTWTVSPYLRHQFGSTATATLRYTRDSVEGGSGVGFGNSLASTRSADVFSGPAFATVGWNLSYTHQELQSQNAGSTLSENSLAGLQWNVLPHFGLTASVGYDKYEYAVINQSTAGPSWSTGFVWKPSSRTNVQASFGRRYFGNTGMLRSSFRTRHTTFGLNYNDSITTTRQQFLLPATVDTAALLDQMFAAAYPDPTERAQVVQAYLAATGLPASLANNVNYLSNRYLRLKRLQGDLAFRGPHTDLVLSIFKSQTTALSLQQEDSSLLATQTSSLNDNTRQRGATAGADYRLSSRTTAHSNFSVTRIESTDTGTVNDVRQVSIGMTRRFNDKINGSLDVRHSDGRVGVYDSSKYHESAIVATLSVQY